MIKFRLADITDAQIVREIYNEHIAVGNSTMDLKPKPLTEIEGWFKGFKDRELIVLLEEGSDTLGWGIIKRYSDRAGYDRACETAIYLRMDETRKGYGSKMKRWIINKCKELGYHHLVAKIFASNSGSIEYNKKLGYEVVGRQKEIGFVDGTWQDVIIMQLLIN
jgi:phosphinothricin acetyltransferase